MNAVSEVEFSGHSNQAKRYAPRESEALSYAEALCEAPQGSILIDGEAISGLAITVTADSEEQVVLEFRNAAGEVLLEIELSEESHPDLFQAMQDYVEAKELYNAVVSRTTKSRADAANNDRREAHLVGADLMVEALEEHGVTIHEDAETRDVSRAMFSVCTLSLH